MAVKILIDPGHYTGVNRSPVVTSYYEGNRMWTLSQYLISALKAYGFEVGCTKSSMGAYPKDSKGQDSVTSRGCMGKGYDFVLSLHSNAAGDYSVERAVSIVFVDDDCGENDDVSYQLGYKIGMAVKNTMGLSSLQMLQRKSSGDRDGDGRVNDDYYGFLFGAHQVGVAAVLMEHGFHTHAATAKWLLSDSNLKKLAEAEAAVLAEWFGLKKGSTTTTSPQESTQATGFYRIRKTWADAKSQVGAYKNLAGAVKTCPAGYKVFDPSGNVVYEPAAKAETTTATNTTKSVAELAQEVIAGKWGTGAARKTALTAAGYNYTAVQKKVNELLGGAKSKSVEQIAREVIAGKWGTNPQRKAKLEAAGYDADAVQKKVNELMR